MVEATLPTRSWLRVLAIRGITAALMWWVVFHVDPVWLRVLIGAIAVVATGVFVTLAWVAWRSPRTGT